MSNPIKTAARRPVLAGPGPGNGADRLPEVIDFDHPAENPRHPGQDPRRKQHRCDLTFDKYPACPFLRSAITGAAIHRLASPAATTPGCNTRSEEQIAGKKNPRQLMDAWDLKMHKPWW